jgi:hypothetical protein
MLKDGIIETVKPFLQLNCDTGRDVLKEVIQVFLYIILDQVLGIQYF